MRDQGFQSNPFSKGHFSNRNQAKFSESDTYLTFQTAHFLLKNFLLPIAAIWKDIKKMCLCVNAQITTCARNEVKIFLLIYLDFKSLLANAVLSPGGISTYHSSFIYSSFISSIQIPSSTHTRKSCPLSHLGLGFLVWKACKLQISLSSSWLSIQTFLPLTSR